MNQQQQNDTSQTIIFDKIKHLEEESIDLETKAADREKKLSYLLTLIREGKDKDTSQISQLRQDLKTLRDQAEQLKSTSQSTIEQIKQELAKMERGLEDSKARSTETEIQIEKQLSLKQIPDIEDQTDKLLKEADEEYRKKQQEYETCLKEAKAKEIELKEIHRDMIIEETKLKQTLESIKN
ncbi:hypothetical protein CYY_009746 [Polysphondylium violaceum]|uniref:Uncharacterized protein n=1 Tax=Polysphondylium violaceum TaxID=133409 RepID=A0A8J4PL01_9MYCE|nr:hypothetical protein CYY_009746 [Polysphondylium violaceum]